MNPSERLEEIETWYCNRNDEQVKWLIERVRTLEKTLEEIKIVDLRDDIPKDHLLALLAMYSAKAILALAGDE